MATTQSLTLTQVSQSVETNKSKVRILWTTTQTGESYNHYDMVGYYWVSINGGAETEYTVYSTLPYQSTKTIVDKTIEVEHDAEGDCTVEVRTSFRTGISAGTITKSASLKLDNIPKATTIDSLSCATKYFTGQMTYKYTPQSANFYNRCNISLNLSGTFIAIKSVNLGKQSRSQKTATVTLSEDELSAIYNKLPNADKGTLRFTFRTYSDSGYSTQIGDVDYKEISLYIPDDSTTKPSVTMELSSEHSLPDKFAGLFIQGKSKVKGNLTAKGKFGTDIKSYSMTVGSASYGAADGYTSDYLSTYGSIKVTGYAKDGRGHTGENPQEINVIAYVDPKLENVAAIRCDKDSNADESGTYLKIYATRSYSPVVSDGEQKNFCEIRYRYTIEGQSAYSDWVTILTAENPSDAIVTLPLLDGNFLATNTYRVEVQAIDEIGKPALATIIVPTDKVYWHRDGKRNALGLGKYNEQDNALDSAWDFYMNNHKITELADPVGDTDAVTLGFLKRYIAELIGK